MLDERVIAVIFPPSVTIASKLAKVFQITPIPSLLSISIKRAMRITILHWAWPWQQNCDGYIIIIYKLIEEERRDVISTEYSVSIGLNLNRFPRCHSDCTNVTIICICLKCVLPRLY